MSAPLWERMRDLADRGHKLAIDLRSSADDLEAKCAGFYGEPQTVTVKEFAGAWARARMLWCQCSGEPLV